MNKTLLAYSLVCYRYHYLINALDWQLSSRTLKPGGYGILWIKLLIRALRVAGCMYAPGCDYLMKVDHIESIDVDVNLDEVGRGTLQIGLQTEAWRAC